MNQDESTRRYAKYSGVKTFLANELFQKYLIKYVQTTNKFIGWAR